MSENQKIIELRKEVGTNKAANAVLHVFALRKRARYRVTLSSLIQKMRAEGFSFTKEDYSKVLKLLVDLGFGTAELDSRGRIKGIKDIKTTLQSIGRAACGTETDLKTYKQRNHFISLVPKQEETKTALVANHSTTVTKTSTNNIKLVVMVGDNPVDIAIPSNISKEELSRFIIKLM